MGTIWFLIDYNNKKVVDMDKCFPERYGPDGDKDEYRYQAFWFSRVVKYLFHNPSIKVSVVSEHSPEFERVRYDEGFEWVSEPCEDY